MLYSYVCSFPIVPFVGCIREVLFKKISCLFASRRRLWVIAISKMALLECTSNCLKNKCAKGLENF